MVAAAALLLLLLLLIALIHEHVSFLKRATYRTVLVGQGRGVSFSRNYDSRTDSYDAAVVGAGIGGMVTAIRLSQGGLKTALIEKQGYLGGRCGSETVLVDLDSGTAKVNLQVLPASNISSAFRFDVGPSLLLLPDVYRDVFQQMNASLDSMVDLIAVQPFYRCFFEEDCTYMDLTSDALLMESQIEAIEPGAWAQFQLYMRTAKGFLNFGLPVFIEEKFQLRGLWEFLSACLVCLPVLPHSRLLQSLFRSDKLRAALSFQDLYVGLSPYRSPAVFSLLQALEFDRKIYYPRGGFSAVVDALTNICMDQVNSSRLDVLVGASVQKIYLDQADRTSGSSDYVVEMQATIPSEGASMSDSAITRPVSVRARNHGEVLVPRDAIKVRRVVVNIDAPAAERGLLNRTQPDGSVVDKDADQRALNGQPSCGVLSINLALDTVLEPLMHHSIFISKHYRQSWSVVENPDSTSLSFNSSAFNFYVHAPSRTDTSTCPSGCDAITILVPVRPLPLTGGDVAMDYNLTDIRDAVLRRLQEVPGMPSDIARHIVHEHYRDPVVWRELFSLDRGAAFGLSHPLSQLAMFRPPIRHPSPRWPRLYRVGASTRPGNGVPLVMISALLASRRVLADALNERIWGKAMDNSK